jgi:hypothetical protein
MSVLSFPLTLSEIGVDSVSMETAKQNRPTYRYHLMTFVDRPDAWGTDLGARVFARINVALMGLSEGTEVLIDYEGLERSDVSFQREAVVETVRKHRPRLLFVVVNLIDRDLRMNLELALERRGDTLLLRGPTGPELLGKQLPREQRRALALVWKLGEATSAVLAAKSDQAAGRTKKVTRPKLSTASSRLIAIWKAGLVERIEGTSPSGGREHRYLSFI